MAIDKNFQAKLNDIKVNAVPKNETIRNLISDFASGKIMIPEYQRTFVWDISKQCRFIESIFIEIPIPPIFLMKKYNDKIEANQFEIIDGVQRITSLNNFFNGSIRLYNLKKLGSPK